MPVRIRLSRGGAKKRPYFRIVIADSRRSRDGKFIERIGTYNPMLKKDNPDRVKIDLEKAKEWLKKGAQPSERVKLFLSTFGIVEKPIITEKTKKHLPKKKLKEKSDEKKADVKDNKPAAKEEQPAAKEEQPAAKEEQPAAKEEQPAAKEEQPAAKEEQLKEEKAKDEPKK